MFGYFGALPDVAVTAPSYVVSDAIPDGSLAVGWYDVFRDIAHPEAGTGSRAFIWTQATGIVSVRSLVDAIGIGDDDWSEVTNARISSDGRYILLGGIHAVDPFGVALEHSRAVVLQLVPKSPPD